MQPFEKHSAKLRNIMLIPQRMCVCVERASQHSKIRKCLLNFLDQIPDNFKLKSPSLNHH